MPMIVVAAIIVVALAAVFAPQLFARLKGRAMTRIQLRDGLAWRGDMPPGVSVSALPPGVWRITAMPTWDENTGVWTMGGAPVWRGGKNDTVTGVWQVMIVVDQAGGVATLGVPVKPGDASYGLVAERVARSLADSIGITWKQQ